MVDSMIIIERTIQRLSNKHARANLIFAWFVITTKDVNDTFHHNFLTRLKAHHLGYKGVNLKITSLIHKETKVMTRAKMKAKGQISTRLQEP